MSKEIDFTEDTIPTRDENAVPDEPIPAAAAPPEDDISVFLDDGDVPPPDPVPSDDVSEAPTPAAAKPKRTSRKKKAASEPTPEEADAAEETVTETEEETAESPVTLDDEALDVLLDETDDAPVPPSPPVSRSATVKTPNASILTLEVRGEVETKSDRDDIIWHEIHNAYRTRKILTGQLGGVEQMENNKTIVVVDYKGFRVVIPLKEMMIQPTNGASGRAYADLMLRQNKLLGKMLGAEIDFIVRGIDSKTRAVVASRKEAMMKKRQTFYMDLDANGIHRIQEGRLVQARVIAVAEKDIRVEIFGVECSILARDLAWYWIGDAHEYYSIGDTVLVRIHSVRRDSLETLSVKADVRSITSDDSRENLKKCKMQSKYAGRVTDIHKGVVFIRLSNGVNAIAHSCYDYRTPGKKDDVMLGCIILLMCIYKTISFWNCAAGEHYHVLSGLCHIPKGYSPLRLRKVLLTDSDGTEYKDLRLWCRNGNFCRCYLGAYGVDGTGDSYKFIWNYGKPDALTFVFYIKNEYYCFMHGIPYPY